MASNIQYPSYYTAADTASKKSQTTYLLFIGINLGFMIIAALMGVYNFQCVVAKLWIYIVSGVLLLSSLIFTIVLRTLKFEDTWYQGRALAESVKTLTWRFITCAETFEKNLTNVDEVFTKRIVELLTEFKTLNKSLDANILKQPIVTDDMKKRRAQSLDERKKAYLNERIIEQKKWYAKKATYNKKGYLFWFICILIFQASAIASVVFLITVPTSNLKFVGLFTTLASAALSWLQLKQHQSLKQAYTTAVLELGIIEVAVDKVASEEALSKFVLDSENAVSREHTLWMAQRRTN
jgi:hypothetical protein